jgi:hypothetical protein
VLYDLFRAQGSFTAGEAEAALAAGGVSCTRNAWLFQLQQLVEANVLPPNALAKQSDRYDDLIEHMIELGQEHQDKGRISYAEMARALDAKGLLAGIKTKTPEEMCRRYVRRGAAEDRFDMKWIRDGKQNVDGLRDKIRSIIQPLQPINVRGVYYQCVSLGLGPKDNKFLKRISRLLVKLREQGIIPWHWISETGREIDLPPSDDGVIAGLEWVAGAGWYNLNPWVGRKDRVQIWIEKRGLAGVIREETHKYMVPLLASGGFSSMTLCNEAAELISHHDGHTYCYYFGDFDPAGVKIDPAIEKRLGQRVSKKKFTFERISLTADDIEEYNLPTRPARKTDEDGNDKQDNFIDDFEEKHGDNAVELDALPPDVLREKVRKVILKHTSETHMKKVARQQESDRLLIQERIGGVIEDLKIELGEDD